ncbi:MAG: M50 family metallopeptidase [Candidatus Gracilibacteria bacterium]|nr:M50 family metallopeptidase [Candidatus Gracilibacteria bacterium]
MTVALGIILAILVFGAIVFFHELGHFSFAKLFGVKVDEFGLGIPPKMMKLFKDKSGTVYTLNWLPIGGFVKLKGEEYSEDARNGNDSLISKSIFKQMIIVLAGVMMNFLLASMIFSTLFYIGTEPLAINTKFQTTTKTKFIPDIETAIKSGILNIDGISLDPIKGSIAEKSGLKSGDILLQINDKKIQTPEEMVNLVKYSPGSLIFKIKRNNNELTFNITPVGGKVGSYVGYNIKNLNKDFKYKYSLKESIREGFIETYNESKLTVELLGNLFIKIVKPNNVYERQEAVNSLGGPIAVGNLFVTLVDEKVKFSVILLIAAVLSINLGVFNLLPFPALDGGRFFVMLINSVVIFFFGKKAIDDRIEQLIHVMGFSILILLSIFIAYQDFFKIFTK